ncbi:hypothetical protein AKJ57_01070 [candidate division MSBL1 archaeon SCGC-AAA259A05]|uniref:3-phosphoglycerate dehydrogenase n=1 Tax=candidate division MSBL1 archaeon SCGC-AAA259A05 TaxID=1698259 RepID=A0A133UB71_9EURY|nr:hypothetical protein AKJ57_01070 [candidate division MSBL1 archaeon SCGC-AAA259A05]
MKVLVADPIHEDGLARLREFAEVELSTDLSHDDLIEKVPEFDAMVVRSATKVGKDVLEAAENLKLIVRAGVGLDNIDLDSAEKIGIKVKNTPEASTNAVAELTMAFMLSWARKMLQADGSLRDGKWIKSQLVGTELRNKTLGIVGVGRIGLEVARKAKAFDMALLGYDIRKRKKFRKLGGEYVKLEKLLKKSDYVTLHVSLSPDTKYMIDKPEIDLMKDSAVLINTARGSVVNEEALIEALLEGKIAGACLDDYEEDPLEDGRLVDLKNNILTPHIGASTEEAQSGVGLLVAEKVKEVLKEY